MLLYLDLAYEKVSRDGRLRTLADLDGMIVEGTAKRLRPKFMTVATMFVGLIPIMWATGTGSDVWKRIAAPMARAIIPHAQPELVVAISDLDVDTSGMRVPKGIPLCLRRNLVDLVTYDWVQISRLPLDCDTKYRRWLGIRRELVAECRRRDAPVVRAPSRTSPRSWSAWPPRTRPGATLGSAAG
jgi:hypothetical protein